MKALVFGYNGQVATELRRLEDVDVEALAREEADLTDPEACVAQIESTNADVVINAAGYTAVDGAEDDLLLATLINAKSPGAMARACAERNLPFVYISTDYIFDGAGKYPFCVDQPAAPLGVYGKTKFEGEEAVRLEGGAFAIFRTSWVVSAHGNNFVKTMLRLGTERDHLSIVGDQTGGPTPAADVAAACIIAARQLLADPSKAGTYHLSGSPDVTWASFARTIFEMAQIPCKITDIPSSDYPTPARRPLNSRLDNSRSEQVFGLLRPDWRVGLLSILKELGALKA